jgi:hypothetical protein
MVVAEGLRNSCVVLSIDDLVVYHPDKWVTRLGASPLLSWPTIHHCIFLLIYHVMLCAFSRRFLPRFWHSLHISSHSIVFSLFSFVLLSCYTFRIMKYLLTVIFSWDIVHENHILSVLGWYWYNCDIWIAIFAYVFFLASNW